MTRILIVKPSSLGDIVHTLPLAHALKRGPPRVVKLLKEAGITLPKWVKAPAADKHKAIRNPEKLRKNQPKEEPVQSDTDESGAE